MALLTRRALQELLDEGLLTSAQLKAIVGRLNQPENPLDAEWELIILSALSRVGVVEHEPAVPGTAKLDLHLASTSGLEFYGDITYLSDDVLTQRNPVSQFVEELRRRLDDERIGGNLTLRIGTKTGRADGDKADVKVLLPVPHEFARYIFNTTPFQQFMGEILVTPGGTHRCSISNDEAQLIIAYSPGSRQTTITHLDYRSPRDIIRNPLYNRLGKKVDQLKRAKLPKNSAPRGVVICDAGSSLFMPTFGHGAVSFSQIAHHFLRTSGTLDFIAAITVKYTAGAPVPYTFAVNTYEHQGRGIAPLVQKVLTEGLATVPYPIRLPLNARNFLEWQARAGITTLSRLSSTPWQVADRLRISSRATMDYLAGRIDRGQFETFINTLPMTVLRNALDQGGTVRRVHIETSANADDDRLIIEWVEHDPAASPFLAPDTRK